MTWELSDHQRKVLQIASNDDLRELLAEIQFVTPSQRFLQMIFDEVISRLPEKKIEIKDE